MRVLQRTQKFGYFFKKASVRAAGIGEQESVPSIKGYCKGDFLSFAFFFLGGVGRQGGTVCAL